MNQTVIENLNTKIAEEFDVIVAGGGPAGIGAAISAARNGMKTLLIERYGFLGGMWTAGLVNPLFDSKGKGGIVGELVEELKNRKAWGGFRNICFTFETLKILLDEKTKEAGVTTLFHTWIAGAVTDGTKVKGVITENKDGRRAYLAKTVIDCTGDGDVAYSAGAEYEYGRISDGKTQPMTLMFVLGNIHFEQNNSRQLYQMMLEAIQNKDTGYDIPYEHPFIIQLPEKNLAAVQLTHMRGYSGINAHDLTEAEMEGRRQVKATVELFKKYIPEFKDVELVYTAPQIGVRETRRIVGGYRLTQEDAVNGAVFDDGITTVTFGIDIHQPDAAGQDVIRVKPYQIPYRCLVPKGLENILVAGRCISGSFEAHASYRVTGNCVGMGQAAGIAAAIAAEEGKSLSDIDIELLKKRMAAQGARI